MLKRTAPARGGVAAARGRMPSLTTRTVTLRHTGHSLDFAGQEPGLRSSAKSQIMNSGSPPPRSADPHTAKGLSGRGPQPQLGEAKVCSRPHGGWGVECVSAGHRSRALANSHQHQDGAARQRRRVWSEATVIMEMSRDMRPLRQRRRAAPRQRREIPPETEPRARRG